MFNKSLGAKYKSEGYAPKKPILIIPGLCSSCLKVVESPSEDWKGKRIWLSMSSIGLDKVWDIMPFFGKKKKKKSGTGGGKGETEVEMAKVDENIKRKWIQHMCLLDDGISDPPGIKLRAVKGLKGCKYLDPGAITDSLSYVFGPFVEMLEDVGYVDGYNLNAAPYDWRLPPYRLEERDHYFTELKRMIEEMYRVNNTKVVIIAHSLGNRVTQYFTKFIEKKEGRQWITKYVDTWMAIGPLFLGAPKLLRAMVTGDRMGLEAFLFPHEGIQLGRSIGSGPWMFPYVTPDYHDFSSYSKFRTGKGKYDPKSNKEILIEGGAENVYNKYRDYYEGDPLIGPPSAVFEAPPIDNLYAIYGINLRTETGYFFKSNTAKGSKKITDFALDSEGSMANYKCEGGIAYETKDTKQACLGGEARGGDGTVPYPSMSYCKKWKNSINVKVVEIEGAEHREILKNKTFWQLTLEFVCQAPPPKSLPSTFADIEYKIELIIKGKRLQKALILDSRFVRFFGGTREVRKGYSAITNISLDDNEDNFVLEFGSSNNVTFYSPQSKQIVQEIAARCRYIEDAVATYTEERNEFGQTLVHQAVLSASSAKLLEVLQENVDVNAVDLQGNTPLITAAEKGYLDLIVVLLQVPNIDVNKQSNNSKSVVHYMSTIKVDQKNQEKWENIMFDLKDRNVNFDLPADLGEVGLHIAVKRSNIFAVSWLASNGANLNSPNTTGETALHYAIRMNLKEIVSVLLESGADKNIVCPGTGSPLELAKKVNPDLFSFINGFQKGSQRKTGGGLGSSGGRSQIKQLEARPITMISNCGENGRTPLHDAAFNDRIDLVFQLIVQYRNCDIVDYNGWTPLHCAASQGNLDILLILLKGEVSINRQTKSGSTILHYLMRLNYENTPEKMGIYKRVLDRVKQKGAQLNFASSSGIVPLHEAALQSNVEGARWLLINNAKINTVSQSGYTALHFAVQSQSVALIELLKAYGADMNVRGKEGTALDVALTTGNQPIINALKSIPPPVAPRKSHRISDRTPPRSPQISENRPSYQSSNQSSSLSSSNYNSNDYDDDNNDIIFEEEDDIIFSKNDEDDIPLSMKRKTSIKDNRTFSTIFSKPITGHNNGQFKGGQNNFANAQYNNNNSRVGSRGGRGGAPSPMRSNSPYSNNFQVQPKVVPNYLSKSSPTVPSPPPSPPVHTSSPGRSSSRGHSNPSLSSSSNSSYNTYPNNSSNNNNNNYNNNNNNYNSGNNNYNNNNSGGGRGGLSSSGSFPMPPPPPPVNNNNNYNARGSFHSLTSKGTIPPRSTTRQRGSLHIPSNNSLNNNNNNNYNNNNNNNYNSVNYSSGNNGSSNINISNINSNINSNNNINNNNNGGRGSPVATTRGTPLRGSQSPPSVPRGGSVRGTPSNRGGYSNGSY